MFCSILKGRIVTLGQFGNRKIIDSTGSLVAKRLSPSESCCFNCSIGKFFIVHYKKFFNRPFGAIIKTVEMTIQTIDELNMEKSIVQ